MKSSLTLFSCFLLLVLAIECVLCSSFTTGSVGNMLTQSPHTLFNTKASTADNVVPMVKTIMSGTNIVGHMAQAKDAYFKHLQGVCSMPTGEIYVIDSDACIIRKINKEGIIVPHAGVDFDCAHLDDTTSPLKAKFKAPHLIACDLYSGDLYVSESDGQIRKITSTIGKDNTIVGSVTTIASINSKTFTQMFFNSNTKDILIADYDNSRIVKLSAANNYKVEDVVQVVQPSGITQSLIDGTIYISSHQHVIYSFKNNQLQIIAGKLKTAGMLNGPASEAYFYFPGQITLSNNNDLMIVDGDNNVIRRLSGNIVSTIIGNGLMGFNGDGLATGVQINIITSLSFHIDGTLLIIDNNMLRKYDQGYLLTMIENKDKNFKGYNVPQEYALFSGREITVNSKNEIFLLNSLNDVLKISSNGTVSKFMDFHDAENIAINSKDELFIGSGDAIYKISPSGQKERVAFDEKYPSGHDDMIDNIDANLAIISPYGIAMPSFGSEIYFSEFTGNRIRKLDFNTNMITTIIGNGKREFSDVSIDTPAGITVTSNNELVISEIGSHIIRQMKWDQAKLKYKLVVLAGRPYTYGYSNTGKATDSLISSPYALFAKGDLLYFTDTANCVIRVVNMKEDTIRDVAGKPQVCTRYADEPTPAASAVFFFPRGLVVLPNDDIIVADSLNSVLRKISKETGMVSVLSRKPNASIGIVDGPLEQATFNNPEGLHLMTNGDILVADADNYVIRKISNNVVSTIAGQPNTPGYKGENVITKNSAIREVHSVISNKKGDIYIADRLNYRIRKIEDGKIRTIAGSYGDNLEAKNALAISISEIAFNDQDEMLIADRQTIRKVDKNGIVTSIVGNGENGMSVFCQDGTNALACPLNAVQAIQYCSKTIYFIEKQVLRYVNTENSKVFSIRPATHIACHKESGNLLLSHESIVYFLSSFDKGIKLISNTATNEKYKDGPLSETNFHNAMFSFMKSGELLISESNKFNNLKKVSCQNEGYRMKDFSSCVKDNCYGKNGICNGNGDCYANQCQCKENFNGQQCEIKILSQVLVSFKQTELHLGNRPSIEIAFIDLEEFTRVYAGRELLVSARIFDSHRKVVDDIKTTVKIESFTRTINVNGKSIYTTGDYRAEISIKDVTTSIDILSTVFSTLNGFTVSNDGGNIGGNQSGSGDNGVATAFAVIFGLTTCVMGVSLIGIVTFLFVKTKQQKPTAYELNDENL